MRAQTTIDFAIGMSLFLVTVAFVISFTPTLVSPFTADDATLALSADRAATQLASDELGDPDTPYVLNDEAVAAFFSNATDATPTDNQSYMRGRLGLNPAIRLNVTLLDGSGSCPGSLSVCRAGPTPPDTESVVAAWRVVWVANERADLRVKVW